MSEEREPMGEEQELEEGEVENVEEGEVVDVDALMKEREAHQESMARDKGWKPLDEFVKDGGDPNDWRPAGEYNEHGKMVGQIMSMKKDFETKAGQLDKLYSAQNQAKIKALEEQLREATKEEQPDADKILRINKEISETREVQPQTQSVDQELNEWNESNPWIDDPEDPKAAYARTQWAMIRPRSTDTASALKQLESKLAQKFPPEKRTVPGGEKTTSKGFNRSGKMALAWEDLTRDEETTYEMTKEGWKSPEEYLKAVAADRKVRKGAA